MLSDVDLAYAEKCPAWMADARDMPWIEVEPAEHPGENGFAMLCRRCEREVDRACLTPVGAKAAGAEIPKDLMFDTVALRPYTYATADQVLMRIWAGQCERCGTVYYAKQRPPYDRRRRPGARGRR